MLKTNPETVRRWIESGNLIAQQDLRKGGNVICESVLRGFVKITPKLEKAHISTVNIEWFILDGIESKRKAIHTKKKTIFQLETEVHNEEKRVSELQSLLENFKTDSVGGVENEK